MRRVEFLRLFENENTLRVYFDLERGEVTSFVVQLECLFGDEWKPVVRYDTAHGFAHRDTIHPRKKTEKTEISVRNYKEGLNFAINDLETNWREYRRRYEEWLKK
ncbi:MAG: hypothetical protein HZB19_13550 [Chloroflexi bacterium]|nr:hypothetical protein [Chloroflexota bacterium]